MNRKELINKLEGTFRDENPAQLIAVREALVNLLVHSDYFSSAKPRIRAFIDRIEFFNYKIVFKFTERKQAKTSEGLNEGLNEGLKTLLVCIKNNPGIKAKETAPLLDNRPIKTIERQVSELKKMNLIDRRGGRKYGGYFMIKQEDDM